MLLALEGLDGSGKTVVARETAQMLGGVVERLPGRAFQTVDPSVFSNYVSLTRYLLYLAGVSYINELAAGDRLVVADRFVASAHALHVDVAGAIAESLQRMPPPAVTLCIYLDVEESERRKRLINRQQPLDPFENRLENDSKFRERVSHRMQQVLPSVRLDTTSLTPQEVAAEIVTLWMEAVSQAADVG